MKPAGPPRAAGWLFALLAFAVPVLAFLALSAAVPERRAVLLVLAVVLLAGTLVALERRARGIVAAERRATALAVAGRVIEAKTDAAAILGGLGTPSGPPLDPSRWDADLFRKPRGIVAADGALNPGPLAGDLALAAVRVRRKMTGTGVLAFAGLLFVGLGIAGRLAGTLRRFAVAYVYTLPAMVGMLLLVFFPFFYGIALSFTDSNIYNSEKPISETWVGLRNFVEILGDFSVVRHTAEGLVFNYQNFYWTLFFTVVWTIANVTVGVTVGLFLALILNTRGLAIRPVYRVLLILPWALPNYITALTWKGMFHPQFGVINQVLQIFGGHAVAWSDSTFTSFLSILATNGWLSFPFMMVISLGALQSIPADLYEAARVDGASRWQQFRSITLPSLKPALIPAVILSVIWTFNMFNIPYLVSAGEPSHSTEILITQAYKFAFEQYRYGYAAAYSTVIFAILLLYGTWQNRITRATEGI
ncbi:MAG: sugar ABC transporter permease [Acidobacteriia bacterium]|nr:sugar ABC transporter permease [Terriglobia bacterium]